MASLLALTGGCDGLFWFRGCDLVLRLCAPGNAQGFQGVDYSTKDRSSGPVQFEADPAEADPFGLDQMLSKVGRHSQTPLPVFRSPRTERLLLSFHSP